jgi:hypothetical protein
MERFEPALADFSEVLRRDPANDQAFYLRGVARSKRDDYPGALADLTEALRLDPANSRAHAYRGLCRQALKQPEAALLDFANAVRLDGRYAAAYCNQRATVQTARGEHEQAAADYSLVLLFDPGNETARSGRDQALRALLARPAPRPGEKAEPPAPPPARPQPPPEQKSGPEQQRDAAASSAARPAPKARPKPRRSPPKGAPGAARKAPKTEVIAPAVLAAAAEESAAKEPAPEEPALEEPAPEESAAELLADESAPEFELGPAYGDSSAEIELVDDAPAAPDSSGDAEAEMARRERLEEERRAELEREREEARVRQLAAERQRMLDDVRRKREDIDRARRAKKRAKPRSEDDDGDGIPWSQWLVRAGVAALVLWGCWWTYDLVWGQTVSNQKCYPCHGSVKFADGKPVSTGTLVLSPTFDGPTNQTDLGAEGTFETSTFSNQGADGVPPGDYKAYLDLAPPLKDRVPAKYLSREQTPWLVKVKKQDNVVELVVDTPAPAAGS